MAWDDYDGLFGDAEYDDDGPDIEPEQDDYWDDYDYPDSWYDLIDEGYGVYDIDVSIGYGEDT
jgi:hypothetical protein